MAMAAEMEPEGPKAEGLRGSGQRVESESSKQGQTQEKRPPRKGTGNSLSGHSWVFPAGRDRVHRPST
jgi:hypothetical protein